jgi:TRAP transporter TAXI family solute receptor
MRAIGRPKFYPWGHRVWIGAIGLAFLFFSIGISAEAQSPQSQWKPGQTYVLRVGASNPSHTTYAIVAAHKAIIEKNLPGVRIVMRATKGGPDNMAMMAAGELEMASNNSAAAYAAHHAKFSFKAKKPFPGLLSFFPIYTLEFGAVVLEKSSVQTFRDLIGKRIALGPKGSGAEMTIMEALDALGLSDKDFSRVQRSAPAQAFNSLAVGNVDAVVWGSGHPTGPMMEFQSTHAMRLVPFAMEDLKRIAAKYPYYSIGKLPANTYKNQPKEVAWLGGSTNSWILRSVPDELVYAMVKSLWENLSELKAAHATQKRLNEESVRMQAAILPFHPGAEKYFKSKGIL